MKATVSEGCIACGLCESICPDVFQIGADGLSHAVGAITPENESAAREAAENCPVSVIHIEA